MCKTEMFVEMVLRMTRIRSKTVQKFGIASSTKRRHNALWQAGIQCANKVDVKNLADWMLGEQK